MTRAGARRAVTVNGYFDENSMLRRIQRERAVALAGPRALLMQAAHPLAVAGLLRHTESLDQPYERLARTAQTMSTIGFGSRADADRAMRHVRAMHRRVRGRLPQAVGKYPVGTPYRADDPELLLWVLFTLYDSGLVVYRKYVGKLSRGEEAAYWDDYRVVGQLFGLRDEHMPPTLGAVDAYRDRMLEGDELFVNEWARRQGRKIVLAPPVPWLAQPLLQAVNFITVALLPDTVRRQYGFSRVPPTVVRKALVSLGAQYTKRSVIPLLPDRLRHVPQARSGDSLARAA